MRTTITPNFTDIEVVPFRSPRDRGSIQAITRCIRAGRLTTSEICAVHGVTPKTVDQIADMMRNTRIGG